MADAAEILGISHRQVARLLARGDLTAVYKHAGIRGPYLLSRTEVEARAGVNGDANDN